ncbi:MULTISPECIES: MFS transporter [Brevibacillus]|uniref:MDR family MFS transporter n=1 Tax=Brevibacillus TaxID=55080 RepID=UPI000EEDE176|nr:MULTISPECIES: MFS transporter [Brevibacillus]MDR4998935.1 MFS transporter [Brevibacillus parabrevis]NRQ56117.1 MFS transporter [Brevibacillus sp. HD1.4A]UED67442.1 MFS transporter [Brevibacillus sp. HD3.3A]HBZ80658.1 MFS transporter [Brevibacillus sp.]
MHLLPASFRNFIAEYPALLWVRLFGETLTSLSSTMIAPFLVLYLSENISGSVTLTMLVIGLQPFSEILLTLFAGGLTDRIRRKTMLLVALLIQGFAMLGMAFADSIAAFAVLYVLNGAGRSLFIPASRAHLADTIPPGQMASAFALLNTSSSIGAAIGPLLGVILYKYNPAMAFLFTAISLFVYAAAVLWKIPQTPLPEWAEAAHEKAPRFSRGAWKAYRPALAIMTLSLPISLFYAQTETNLQLHMKNTLPDYLQALALLIAVKGILLIMFEFLLVKWTQHMPARWLITASYGCFFLVALGYAYIDSLPLLLAMQVLLVIGESVGLTQLLAFVTRIAPSSMRGRYFAITGTHWDISRMCGPYLGSLVLLHYGGTLLFTIVAGILVIGAFAMHRYLTAKEKTFPLAQEG